jgi:Flp pilus assembly protein TadG
MKGTGDALMENGKAVTTKPAFARRLANLWRKHLRNETGAEIIEFYLCTTLYLVFCFGFLELCVVLFTVHCIGDASRQSARWASVRGTASSTTSGSTTSCVNPNISTCPAAATDIQTYAQKMPGMSSRNTTVTVNWCGSDGVSNCSTSASNALPGNIVKVTVTYRFAQVPFFSKAAITLNSTAEKVIWQ